MKDTAGKEIYRPINCDCGLTSGCRNCNPARGYTRILINQEPLQIKGCWHRWQKCSDNAEHCIDCGSHRNINKDKN